MDKGEKGGALATRGAFSTTRRLGYVNVNRETTTNSKLLLNKLFHPTKANVV